MKLSGRFITVFTRARHHSLSLGRSIQSIPSNPIPSKIHFNIILPPTAGFEVLLVSSFLLAPLHRKIYLFVFFPMCATCEILQISNRLIYFRTRIPSTGTCSQQMLCYSMVLPRLMQNYGQCYSFVYFNFNAFSQQGKGRKLLN
jgi:hypothetical protein